jgi:hypothetical protein
MCFPPQLQTTRLRGSRIRTFDRLIAGRERLTAAKYSRVLLACMAITAWACNPYLCIYETRFIATQPQETVTGAGSFAGYVNFRDYVDDGPVPPSIVWLIEMTSATATPTRLLLADRRDTTLVLADMPIQQTQSRISVSAVDVGNEQERDRVFEILSTGNGVLILTLSDRASPLLIPLRVTDRENWHRPNCS